MTWRLLVRLIADIALIGCATSPTCKPVGIVVAAKDQRTTIRQQPAGLTAAESGYVREAYGGRGISLTDWHGELPRPAAQRLSMSVDNSI